MNAEIEAVAFDCFGTLLDFGDEAFVAAYGLICSQQAIAVDGQTFYDKWMEVWRRLTLGSEAASANSGEAGEDSATVNSPGPLSEAKDIPGHPQHHTPSAGRDRSLDGPPGVFRTYREEWTEHFAICFEELGVQGDAAKAHEHLRDILCKARAFPESQRTVERLSRRLPVALMSNADDDFLYPPLSRNGLIFPLIVSSESAQAYKPHVAIFRHLSERMGLEPSRILYVGDSLFADVTGAKHAGMKAAWVNRRRDSAGSASGRSVLDPDFEIETLDGLIDLFGL